MYIFIYMMICVFFGLGRIIFSQKKEERFGNLFMGTSFLLLFVGFLQSLPGIESVIIDWNMRIDSYPILLQLGYHLGLYFSWFVMAGVGLFFLGIHLYGVGRAILSPDEAL